MLLRLRVTLVATLQKSNGELNQYTSSANNYPNPPLHWGSPILYDDNFGGPWVFPGNGVTMAEGWIVASYNALNQPVAIGCNGYGSNYMWFGFDPLGRCVKRWKGPASAGTYGYTPATFFSYDGWNMVQEGATAATADRVYVNGGRVDEIVASRVSGIWYDHHYDAQGNCILLSTASGGIEEQYDYDAFGYPYLYDANGNQLGAPSLHTRFLFTGREWISDLRIYDYRNRQYQPELGRFLQPDPRQFEAGDYNLYRYCHNDPVNKSDPLGLYEEDVHFALTILLARNVGFSQASARNIAAANQGVDTNPATAPIGGGFPARKLYHFTTEERRTTMRNDAFHSTSEEAFGRYLHALQDSYSHQRGQTDRDGAPYGPVAGHFHSTNPDKTHLRPELAEKMAKDTYCELRRFYQNQTGKEAPDNWLKIRRAISDYLKAKR